MKNNKIIFIVNKDSFFISHRLSLAKEALSRGMEVHLICKFSKFEEELMSLGVKTHNINFSNNTNLFREIVIILTIRKLIKDIIPDIVHCISIKPVIYTGLIISSFSKEIKFVAAISGLGSMFIGKKLLHKIRRKFFLILYKIALNGKAKVIFQNDDDKKLFLENNIINNSQTFLIRGSGVDLNKFYYEVESISSIKVIFLGRLLKDKGITEFIDSARLTRNIHPEIKFLVVGDSDYNNPSSISNEQILSWKDEGVVEFLGYKKNIDEILRKSNIVVLPSYREGLPKVLIEAASTGRSVVTTNVPGCRDAIINNKTGLLVPVKDSEALHKAIVRLALNNDLRLKFGKNGRKFAEMKFSIDDVIRKHFHLYENV